MKALHAARCAAGLALVPLGVAHATIGIFEHGNGIKSMGMGGVAYSVAEETTALAANPANAWILGNRWDFGVDVFGAKAVHTIHGNALGADEVNSSDGKTWYDIPQGGIAYRLRDDVSLGVTLINAGLGPDYDGSPYQRFGGGHRTNLLLASSGIVTALAWHFNDWEEIGISLNTGYQVLKLEGLQFLDNDTASSHPGHVTDQGKDGSYTIGFTVGWRAKLAPWLVAGAAYRSRNWTQKHKEYDGLVAGGGRLDLPQIFGGGFTIAAPGSPWSVTVEGQRFLYGEEDAFSNRISAFEDGNRLGENDGAGFGFRNVTAIKAGVQFQATPQLRLRAGYAYNTSVVRRSETLFGALGCVTTKENITLGATYGWQQWELTGMAFDTVRRKVHGENSIPDSFGGGEADLSDKAYGMGLSVGRKF